MTPDTKRAITQSVKWTVVAHTLFVLMGVVAKNVLWDSDSPWWKLGKVFRAIESPVLWVVDPTVQRLPLIPPSAAFGRIWVATSVSELIAYGVFGGAFYVLLAVTIAYAWHRRRGATSVKLPS